MKFKRACSPSLATALLALALMVLVSGCARHTTEITRHIDRPYPVKLEPKPDTRQIMVSGVVIGAPASARSTQTLMAGKILNEDEVYHLTGGNSPNQMIIKPRMKVTNGDTGRFKLGVAETAASIRIELTPTIGSTDEVTIGARIEATGVNGRQDHLSQSPRVPGNTGRYAVFGPLAMDDQVVYAVLKANVLPE